MQKLSRTHETPLFIHSVNVSALLLGGVILFLTAVTRTAQLVILVPVLALLGAYWRLWRHPSVVAWYFGMAIALCVWILLCEHIVILDKVLGTHVSEHLLLGVRLATYVLKTLPGEDHRETEACCHDPLTWHYRPGSRYRATFDCPTCAAPYEITVDESGYLNQPLGLLQRHPQIDLFIAGDSVLQGIGVPSVVEQLRRQLPLRLWNLSIQAYGPRQKINALLTYALPHTPQWLVVEFYGGNDVAEAIQDDVCQSWGDYRCRYNRPTLARLFAHHPFYVTLFDVRTDAWARLADYTTENLTLATTRYLIDALKGVLKQPRTTLGNAVPRREAAAQVSPPRLAWEAGAPAAGRARPPAITQIALDPWLALGAGSPVPVREGQWLAYVHAGLAATQHQYERLGVALAGLAHPPAVILLYNPAPYEVYRGMGIEPNPRAEQMYPLQRDVMRAFAHTQGWHFLDLTEPLRAAVQDGEVWLYGYYDQSHWSPQGTAIAAEVLAAELLKIIRGDEEVRQRPPTP